MNTRTRSGERVSVRTFGERPTRNLAPLELMSFLRLGDSGPNGGEIWATLISTSLSQVRFMFCWVKPLVNRGLPISGSLTLVVLFAVAGTLTSCTRITRGAERSRIAENISRRPQSKVEEVPFCDLLRNAHLYQNRAVTTDAIFFANHENETLYSSECADAQKYAWVEFAGSYAQSNQVIDAEFRDKLCPQYPCAVRKALIKVVGKLEGPNEEGYGHLNAYSYKFEIAKILQVEVARERQ